MLICGSIIRKIDVKISGNERNLCIVNEFIVYVVNLLKEAFGIWSTAMKIGLMVFGPTIFVVVATLLILPIYPVLAVILMCLAGTFAAAVSFILVDRYL